MLTCFTLKTNFVSFLENIKNVLCKVEKSLKKRLHVISRYLFNHSYS